MEIDIWNNKQVQEHLDRKEYPVWHSFNGLDYISGFNYIHPNFIASRLKEFDNYEDSLQDRNIVALDDSGLVGMVAFMYQNKPAPHFFPKFLEVRSDYLHRGIATSLVKRIAEPCFLLGSALNLNDFYYTEDGRKYLKNIIDKEWFQGHFRVIDFSDDI
jgi:hypothetical protein